MTNQPHKVLLIDDNAELVESVQFALEQEGLEVIIASDGLEGMKRAERDHPDLIVLDLVMPGQSGFGVLDHLHPKRSEAPPIIMVTANDEQRHRDYAASQGVKAFLPKPFDLDELVAAVHRYLPNAAE